AGEPDVRRVAAFFDGGVGKGDGGVEIAAAGEGDGFGGEQFGLVRETFERFVGPEFGFAIFAEFDEHADLAGPGGDVGGVVFENLGVRTKAGLEVAGLK